MKKYSIITLLTAILGLSSCNFLDQVSPNDISTGDAIRSGADAEAALLGVYNTLQQGSYYGGQFPLMSEGLSDNATTGGYSYLSLDQIGNKQVTPANALVQDLYISMYRTIVNCNYLLGALPGVTGLEDQRRQEIEAHARAIRAMAHFDVLRYFGEHWDTGSAYGIPVISAVQGITDIPVRATVEETYSFIIDELKSAQAGISPTDDRVQYVNLHTINGLLARVYLYKKDYVKAAEHAGYVISDSPYSLLDAAQYGDIFSTRRSSESIFELAFNKQNRSDFNGLTYSRDDALRTELFYLASEDLNNFFRGRPGDVRATLLDYDVNRNDVTIVPDGRTQKYRGEESRDNPAYILRLAEMYLIRAEALGRSAGLDDLNQIRTRRGLQPLAAADVPTDADFLRAVLDERRAEFNFEGHRYFDLARTRQIGTVLNIEEFRSILPIPSNEIATGQGRMEQNPGY
ncbi:MAG: RagB/SusD family nutrient uptake outer membrane protein [Bacteroidota bacterium]